MKDSDEIAKSWFFEGIGLMLLGVAVSHVSLNAGNNAVAWAGFVLTALGAFFTVLYG